ncbi:hypothetical protein LR48_Vigan406s013500 [Vigna angularis]|uniref:RING-type E3 ubiquitin transferase n=2 Tax=Phaseolus angularis TaxID=3914 RepID=A0A0L9T9N4_PHAAN|nr:uncharacterized protein LOC108320655 [Vigna angularis]KAG2379794.1 uncharacterized protein HKW66_Vig0165730 [Vigna angularis]KOM27325.1 hypothetical protein LR48_Vigan406s013500 [Vigna angularis]BAT98545.1 hypothetical protein VIGAN_09220600 [Vigna angularis var. angularis]
MKFLFSAIVILWCVCDLLVVHVLANSRFPEEMYSFDRNPQVTYKYDRMSEVQKQCASVLSASSELRYEYSVTGMKGEFSFVNGDWRQDGGKFPIMPFDASISPGTLSEDRASMNLVSFWVSDVDLDHRLKKSIPINGFMVIGITRDGNFVDNAFDGNPEFRLWPSHSQLSISFQGIYTESKKNGGERVLCLLGNTMLPTREADPANPWSWMKNPGDIPLSEDDQILLVLRYPLSFTLTNRIINGELKSLNRESNSKYFDVVHMLSQLGKSAKYTYGSQQIVSKACNPYPVKDNLTDDGTVVYKGARFCEILEEITREKPLSVVSNWRCNGTDDFCSKLGPFLSDKEIKSTDGGFQGVKLYMQDVICSQEASKSNTGSTRVSTVFRAISPSENEYTAAKRSGPSNTSLAAEGIWKSSSGQLCMVGCLGVVDAKGSSCNTRICMYIPTTFSLKQHSIILGTLSPISNSSAFFPLSFEQLVLPSELWNYFKLTNPHYSYSKTTLAGAVLEKNEPFSFTTVIKKSLLTFPKLEDNEAFQDSLSLLAEDLTYHVSGFPDPLPNVLAPRIDIQLEILSVGPLFGRYWYDKNGSASEQETPYHATAAEYTEKQLLINVSAQLSLAGKGYSNFSVLFLEGLYDPHVGKMYLIGCRDVRASWKVLYQSYDLEAGMDCLIEVVVAYPPTTTRWLVDPRATISIESQRNDDDSLRFDPIKLKTFPIIYRKQREDVLSRRGVEGILRLLTLSFAIGCILSQLFYIQHSVDSLPYISLVVLGVQALGYTIPLVTGAEALFKKMVSESYDVSSSELESSEWLHVIDYSVKLLLIVSLLITLRLFQKVWKSRIRLQTRSPLEPHRVPSDKWVFLCTFFMHVIGYVIVLIVHGTKTSQKDLIAKTYVVDGGNSHPLPVWATKLQEYVGLVEDFFLLPQIIGNLFWHIHCKPLRKLYFIGITVVRLLPHIYDCIRAPVSNPYFSEDSEFVNPNLDFYSKFGDIAISVTAVVLAIVVYIQQRWSYEKLSQFLTFGKYKLLPTFKYQRLSSGSCESELVPGINGSAAKENEQVDVE